jgi:hypothetical protein
MRGQDARDGLATRLGVQGVRSKSEEKKTASDSESHPARGQGTPCDGSTARFGVWLGSASGALEYSNLEE